MWLTRGQHVASVQFHPSITRTDTLIATTQNLPFWHATTWLFLPHIPSFFSSVVTPWWAKTEPLLITGANVFRPRTCCAKMAETIEVLLGGLTHVDPRNHVWVNIKQIHMQPQGVTVGNAAFLPNGHLLHFYNRCLFFHQSHSSKQ